MKTISRITFILSAIAVIAMNYMVVLNTAYYIALAVLVASALIMGYEPRDNRQRD